MAGGIDSATKLLLHAGEADASTFTNDSSNYATYVSGVDKTVLCLHFDGANLATTTPDAATNKAITFVGTAKISTAQSKFGGSSLLLDGNSDYVSLADSDDWNLDGNWTFEFWVNLTDNTGTIPFISQWQNSSNEMFFYRQAGGKLNFYVYVSPDYVVDFTTVSAVTMNTGTWYHIAVVRDGSTPYIFINGVSEPITVGTAFGVMPDLSAALFIGAKSTSFYLNGNIDDFRIVKGKALYTANFTPPTVSPSPKDVTCVGNAQIDTFISWYPPTQNGTYVKATTTLDVGFEPYLATDPTKSVTGNWTNNSWIGSGTGSQRFHIDLGSAQIVKKIYYENVHETGSVTTAGVQNFTFWGSNTAGSFAELTYGTDTGWTQLTTSQSTFDQHTGSDVADPKYITVTNTTAYRYYAFKFADNYGHGSVIGFRRVQLQGSQYFGIGSILFDGTGDYLTLVDSDDWLLDAGNGSPFTIDTWFRLAIDVPTNDDIAICGQYDDSTHYWAFALENYSSANHIAFYSRGGSGTITVGVTSTIAKDTWYHLALAKTGSSWYFFLSGVQQGATQTSAETLPDLTTTLNIGKSSGPTSLLMNGWIDEFRISKGIARWTANFTPETSEYNTSLDATFTATALTLTTALGTPTEYANATHICTVLTLTATANTVVIEITELPEESNLTLTLHDPVIEIVFSAYHLELSADLRWTTYTFDMNFPVSSQALTSALSGVVIEIIHIPSVLALTLSVKSPVIEIRHIATALDLALTLGTPVTVVSYIESGGVLTLTLYQPTVNYDMNFDIKETLALTARIPVNTWPNPNPRPDEPVVIGGCPSCGSYLYN